MKFILAAGALALLTANGPHPNVGLAFAGLLLFAPFLIRVTREIIEGFFLGIGGGIGLRIAGAFRRRGTTPSFRNRRARLIRSAREGLHEDARRQPRQPRAKLRREGSYFPWEASGDDLPEL